MGLVNTFSVSISAHQKGPVRPMVNFGLRFPSRPFPLQSSLSVTSLREMARENPAEKALSLLRSPLCDPNFAFKTLSHSDDSNYNKLKFLVSSSVTAPCNSSILLLGPRGSGKIAIRLSGLLHSSDNCAFKEIARQLCMDHQLVYSRMLTCMASFDDNSQFMIAMLRECGLAHKTIIFVLDEFDLFALGKQRLLYSLLDAMQSVTSQAVVIGVSSRLDADMLLDKRVRSRFSHRKLLFLPPAYEDIQRLLEHILVLPTDLSFPPDYAIVFNAKLQIISADERFKEIVNTYLNLDSTVKHLLRYLIWKLSLENFKTTLSNIQRHPKLECIEDCSVLELYILVCMKRLEVKEQNSYNFDAVMKEYKSIHDSVKTADHFARNACLRAFEHLLQRELIGFADNRGQNQSVEFSPVKLLISSPDVMNYIRG